MKNFRHDGRTCTFIAPYAVASGGGFVVGSIFAVAAFDAAQGAEVEGDVTGVFTLPKPATNGSGFDPGTKLYWDNVARQVTKTATNNILIGAALGLAPIADSATSCSVHLNGVVNA